MRLPLFVSCVSVGIGLAGCSSSTPAGTAGSNGASAGTTNSAGAGGSKPSGGAGGGANADGGKIGSAAGAAGSENAGSENAGTAGSTGLAGGTIVPLYTDPSDASWSAIIGAKKAHPAVTVVAIVNPNSGPGAQVDSAYSAGIAKLLSAAIVPVGYVSTAYTARGEAAVRSDIASWHSFYPNLKGIFFDEQSDKPGDEGFYRDVAQYAKQQGLAFSVGNPGTSVPASYLDTVDVMLIYEQKGLPALSTLSGDAVAREHYGIIPYAAAFDAAFVSAAKADVGYVYATSDDLPNPWDSLTPYFSELLTSLEP